MLAWTGDMVVGRDRVFTAALRPNHQATLPPSGYSVLNPVRCGEVSEKNSQGVVTWLKPLIFGLVGSMMILVLDGGVQL